MKVYVINLKKDRARLESVSRQLAAFGMPFERIEAVYGKGMSQTERHRDVARFRSILANGGELLDGEIGCSLSHIKVYREMTAESVAAALILEDDIIMTDAFPFVISQIENEIDVSRPQVFFPASASAEPVATQPYVEVRRVESTTFADAYVITLPAAKLVLLENYPVKTVADCWTRWHQRRGLELFRCLPPTAYQANDVFLTEIQCDAKKLCNPLLRYLFSIKRKFLKAIDLMLWKVFRS